MQRFIPLFVLVALITLPGLPLPQCELPHPTDTEMNPVPITSNSAIVDLPNFSPTDFEGIWIFAYQNAITQGRSKSDAETLAWKEWADCTENLGNTIPCILTENMKKALKQGDHIKIGKTTNRVNSQKSSAPETPLQPGVRYDSSNMDAVSKDINKNRGIITVNRLKPETVLKLYEVPAYSIDYLILFKWIEEHLYESVMFVAAKENRHSG